MVKRIKDISNSIRVNGFLTIMVLSVVKDVSRQWFLASLPSSVGFMCCTKDLYNYLTGVYLYEPQSIIVDYIPQMWTTVHNHKP